ncbi:MAG: SRPBCC family protein [Silicimonas sp.]|nr:SRPBCC family protein [Silicimonas sp.]
MKLSTREDIDAPIATVYKAVSDFDAFERQLLRRGVDVTRDDSHPLDAPGLRWQARFDWRGKPQALDAELIAIEPNQGYTIESKASGVVALSVVDLVALSKTRTRLFVSVDLRPTTLTSRLFVHSLKLGKSALSRRFKARVSDFASKLSG